MGIFLAAETTDRLEKESRKKVETCEIRPSVSRSLHDNYNGEQMDCGSESQGLVYHHSLPVVPP